ncbi:MAG: hypothetical protein HRT37_24790 [Alteromonadaceae bacterium]|nr:hypothetical protein [Alteromonadaceae bacterium]
MPKRHLYTGVLLLVSLLFSFGSHSHEVTNDVISIEQFDCNLCQHNIDTPSLKLKLFPVNVGQYRQPLSLDFIVDITLNRFYFALQRAPPVFL